MRYPSSPSHPKIIANSQISSSGLSTPKTALKNTLGNYNRNKLLIWFAGVAGSFQRVSGYSYEFPHAFHEMSHTAALSCVSASSYSSGEQTQVKIYVL